MQSDGDNDSTQKYMPQVGEICTAKSEAFGEWYAIFIVSVNFQTLALT